MVKMRMLKIRNNLEAKALAGGFATARAACIILRHQLRRKLLQRFLNRLAHR